MLLQLHLHSRLNTWFQWIAQRQLQDETGIIEVLVFGVPYIRDLTEGVNVLSSSWLFSKIYF